MVSSFIIYAFYILIHIMHVHVRLHARALARVCVYLVSVRACVCACLVFHTIEDQINQILLGASAAKEIGLGAGVMLQACFTNTGEHSKVGARLGSLVLVIPCLGRMFGINVPSF